MRFWGSTVATQTVCLRPSLPSQIDPTPINNRTVAQTVSLRSSHPVTSFPGYLNHNSGWEGGPDPASLNNQCRESGSANCQFAFLPTQANSLTPSNTNNYGPN